MIRKVNRLLDQLHPGYADVFIYIRTISWIAIGVFFILLVIQPSNFSQRLLFDNVWLTALINSGCCYITMLICLIWIKLFPKVFAPENWTLRRELCIIIYQMVSITLAIWLLNSFLGFYDFSFRQLGKSFFNIFFIGIIPYMLVTFIRHIYLLKKRLKKAKETNRRFLREGISSDSEESLYCPQLLNRIAVSEFYYAESRGNDLFIFCIKYDEPVEYKIRCTLRSFVKDNAGHGMLFRSHRSFVVNTEKILRAEGNAASYHLLLHKRFPFIPVSRSYIAAFKNKLQKQNECSV